MLSDLFFRGLLRYLPAAAWLRRADLNGNAAVPYNSAMSDRTAVNPKSVHTESAFLGNWGFTGRVPYTHPQRRGFKFSHRSDTVLMGQATYA